MRATPRHGAHSSLVSALDPQAGEGAQKDQQRDVLTFAVGDEIYALGISFIREIIKSRPITEVPRVPAFVAGIISVRGIVMPVIDLRLRLRLQAPPLSHRARILVVMQPEAQGGEGREPCGLLVDAVHHVVRLVESDIEPPTMLSGYETEFVDGIGRVGAEEAEDGRGRSTGVLSPREREIIILLNLARVLSFEPLAQGFHAGSGAPPLPSAEPRAGDGGKPTRSVPPRGRGAPAKEKTSP